MGEPKIHRVGNGYLGPVSERFFFLFSWFLFGFSLLLELITSNLGYLHFHSRFLFFNVFFFWYMLCYDLRCFL